MRGIIRGAVSCSVTGCSAPHRARGLCNTHYHQHYRRGSLPPRQYENSCTIEDCQRPLEARGLCKLHYQRWFKRGSPDLPRRPTPEERFWSKVKRKGPKQCWIWLGSHSQIGHGTFWSGSRPIGAHRFSYELAHGPIPTGLIIDHLCNNPPCVNPAHMELVSHQENTLRAVRKDTCINGHLLTPETSRSYGGGRRCLICHRDRERARRGEVVPYLLPPRDRG